MSTESKFDLWCIVELFGHQKIAGRCTEQNIAGSNMLRVDVPETEKQPPFTRYFGGSAIYAINPVDERTARLYAQNLEVAPVQSWQGAEFARRFAITGPVPDTEMVNSKRSEVGLPNYPGDDMDPDDRIDF